jgi:hypothetical protein
MDEPEHMSGGELTDTELATPPHLLVPWASLPEATASAGSYCLDFWSRDVIGCTVIVKSHCTHFQVSSIGARQHGDFAARADF